MTEHDVPEGAMVRAPFRIAIRQEGNVVNAYVAKNHTMDDADFLGSIALGALEADPTLINGFKELMMQSLAALYKKVTGTELVYGGEESIAEHERPGHA